MHCIRTVVVRPIVTYAATVWWNRVKLRIRRAELSKLQRMACLCITGAMRTTQTAAIEVLLEVPPLHLLRLEQEFIVSTAVINGNPNLKVLDMHT
jgi:hypothetical protein